MNDEIKMSKSPSDPDSRVYSAPALEKGLDILELLCAQESPLSQKDIARMLGRSVSEIYRMLSSLISRNYVAQIGDSYYITTKMFELSHNNPPTQRLLVEARPVMQRLASELDQSCHLTVYGQGRQVVIAKVDTPSGMGFSVRVGSELELLISASGRVLMAFQDEDTRQLRLLEALQRRPEHDEPHIDNVLNFVRERGYESMASVQVRGLYAVSFPVLDSQGHAIAALTVPFAERIDQTQRTSIPQVHEALALAARNLSLKIGGRYPD
jgi:DNA-binding IclR family transcriptional regulator